MARSSVKTEHILYLVILLLAAALRFGRLGVLPLNEFEAQAAMQAHDLDAGNSTLLGSQPAYILLTSVLFSLLPSSEFLARFWPVLFGLCLVALPYFWRDLLGRKAALLLALGLALDPGLVAISRLASGRMLAVAGVWIALTAWRQRLPILAGIFAVMALLAAPTVYFGVLGIGLLCALFFSRGLRLERELLKPALAAAGATLVFGSTLFFSRPQGLASIGSVLTTFISGWTQPSGVPVVLMLFSLLGYSLPALIFGILGAVRAWTSRNAVGQVLSVLTFINIALVLIYPGRQVADLLWALLPLWALAAIEVSRYLEIPTEDAVVAFGEAGLMALLFIFFVLTLAKTALNQNTTGLSRPYLILAIGVLVLAVAITFLVALGWSRQPTIRGLVWALSFFSILFLISASSRFQRSVPWAANDLWSPGPAAGEGSLLANTVERISFQNTGQPIGLPVDVRIRSAALKWMLRRLPPAAAESPASAIIITLADSMLSEASSYRGQSFALQFSRSWDRLPPSYLNWLLYRKALVTPEQVILWVNLNLFPDAANQGQNQSTN